MAQAISRKTGIDDEAIQSGENLLLTFTNIRNEVGRGNDIFNQATVAITDMSVALGQDFKSSAIQVGKALNDPVQGLTALRRVGVSFTEQQEKMVENWVRQGDTLRAQRFILEELTTEFGGSAEAQKTASQTMATSLGNLAEVVGGLVAPAFTFLADNLQIAIKFLQKELPDALQAVAEWFQKVWDRVQPLAEGIANVLWPALQAAWNAIRDRLVPALERLWEAFGPIIKVLGIAAALFGTVVVGQVLVLVTAISHLIDWFSRLVDWVREHLAEPIVGAIEKIIDFIGKLIGWVKDRLVDAWQAIKAPVLAVINAIIGGISTLIGWIKDAIDWLRQLTQGVGEALAQRGIEAGVFEGVRPPGAQHGGVVTRSGLAMIHKGEVFSGVNNEMGFGGIQGDIVLQVDGQTFARITRDQLLKLQKRNATSGI